MRVYFEVPDTLKEGIALLADELGIACCGSNTAQLSVIGEAVDGQLLEVELRGSKAAIRYGGGTARFYRGLSLLLQAVREGKARFASRETPLFEKNGGMFDVSRNAAMNPDTVKFILRKMALMGLNQLLLYMEDMYEIPEQPYFGHMRGRYTCGELRALDRYALALGIELVPCVQTLGHMARYLQWPCAAPVKDTQTVLLCDEEETYRLIDGMFAALAAAFSTNRVHIGMDEAHDMGLGAYYRQHGCPDRFDLFCRHLRRVAALAKKHGFARQMMWSDMFFRIAAPQTHYHTPGLVLPRRVLEQIPPDVQQVYWDYGPQVSEETLQLHGAICQRPVFAGGIWTFLGYCPHYRRTIENLQLGLGLCKKNGIKEVLATVWHNSAACSLVLALPGLQMYAEYDYGGTHDTARVAQRLWQTCGLKLEDVLALEAIDQPDGGTGNGSLPLLYNDPLLGLFDRHVQDLDTQGHYAALKDRLAGLGPQDAVFRPAFDVLRHLVDVLEMKADFGVRLKTAYDTRDAGGLAALRAEAGALRERIEALRAAHLRAWQAHNKMPGWECIDSHYGTLLSRFATTQARITDLLEGRAEHLEELDAPRLWADCRTGPQDAIPRNNLRFTLSFTPAAMD